MKSLPTTHQSINEEQLDLSRARRVWQYFGVTIVAWISFTVLFPLLGYPEVLPHHFIALSCFGGVYLWFRGDDISSRERTTWFTHCFIGIHAISIFFIALASPDLESNLCALPFGTTIAFLLLGRREAIPWLVVSIMAYVIYPLLTHGFTASLPPSPIFMDGVVKTGGAIVIFVCLCQFEQLYQRRSADLVQLSQNLKALATTDALTGLPNRFWLNEEITNATKEVSPSSTNLALLVLDMDGFKKINDTLGHTVGDEALIEVAARLKQINIPNAAVARLGGDEFCMLIHDVTDRGQVEELGMQLHAALCQPYELVNVTSHLGVSIGVAFFPDDALTPEVLLTYADTAMYHAKENHLPLSFYNPEQTAKVVEYCKVQEKLSNAIEQDEFFLVYQPQIDVRSGKVVGAEALLRWKHEGKIIPPYEFIPHLESSRRITEVTAWILNKVCEQVVAWNAKGLEMKVAVNISAVDFHSAEFVDVVNSAIERTQIDASLLELEVTEGVLIEDVSTVAEKMRCLKKSGLTISIDDFGTGYSSLAYIRSLPIDKLKIDREFVKGIPDQDDGTIASSIVLLAKSLGFEVLAEGVETEAQLEYLRARKCEQYQGYLACRPVSATELLEYAVVTNDLSPSFV